MTEYKELVWIEKGFRFDKSDLFGDEDEQNEEVFFGGDTLEKALTGNYTQVEQWFHKYCDEAIFDDEEEALDSALDYCEDDKEREILEKRLEELEETLFTEAHIG